MTVQERVQSLLWRAATLVGVAGCLAVVGLYGWIMYSLQDFEPFVSDTVDPTVIEANGAFELPPSAHDIFARTEGFQDITTKVRFSMTASDLERFLSSTHCSGPLVVTDPALQFEDQRVSWWRPMDALHLEQCTGEVGHDHQRVLVDMSDEDVYIVYVSNAVY